MLQNRNRTNYYYTITTTTSSSSSRRTRRRSSSGCSRSKDDDSGWNKKKDAYGAGGGGEEVEEWKVSFENDVTIKKKTTDARRGRGRGQGGQIALPGIDWGLIRDVMRRQAVIGGIGIVIAFPGMINSISWPPMLDQNVAWLGVGGGLSLVLFGFLVEMSDNLQAAVVTHETELFVLRLFGYSFKPVKVGLVALALASLAAWTEEIVFRGVALPNMIMWGGGSESPEAVSLAIVVSSLSFGLAHWGGDRSIEALFLVLLEASIGSVFALLYIASGYNILVPICAHTIYDFEAIIGPHFRATERIQYASKGAWDNVFMNTIVESDDDGDSIDVTKARARELGFGPFAVSSLRAAFLLIDRNRNGRVDIPELRIALYSLGVRMPERQVMELARECGADSKGTLDFPQFMTLASQCGARPDSLLNGILGR